MTELEKMCAGKFYNPTDFKIILKRTRARMLADKFNRTKAWNIPKRKRIIKKLFPNGGKNAFFEPTIRIEYGFNVTYGDNFFMNFDCKLLDVTTITIGNDVMFGPNVTIATPMHPLVADERAQKQRDDGFYDLEYAKPIKIGNNCWLASGVTVCGGVEIGDNCVIAAGSVVTRDIPSDSLAAGVPCKVIRKITEADRMFPEKIRE